MNARSPLTRDFFETKFIPEPNSGCWLWLGSVATNNGYGRVRWGKKKLVAHRVSYELYVGPVPEGAVLDHKCRVPSCVNPDHVEPTTQLINMQRSITACKTHCSKGHLRTLENTEVYFRKDFPGQSYRRCLVCYRTKYPRSAK